MITEADLFDSLLNHGEVFLPLDHTLLEGQSATMLFNALSQRLQEASITGDFEINSKPKDDGILITAKVGEVTDTNPDFSPREPSPPWWL